MNTTSPLPGAGTPPSYNNEYLLDFEHWRESNRPLLRETWKLRTGSHNFREAPGERFECWCLMEWDKENIRNLIR